MTAYDVIYADPPWTYRPLWGVTRVEGGYRKGNPCGASAHYPMMTDEQILDLPVGAMASDAAALFLWATCPRLDMAMKTMKAWGFGFKGVAWIWVKTKLDGTPMGAKGPPPSFVKPTTEMVLVGSNVKKRPFPILDCAQRQVVMAPRRAHSAKPPIIRDNIVALCGDRPRIELFARERVNGWDAWGNEVGET